MIDDKYRPWVKGSFDDDFELLTTPIERGRRMTKEEAASIISGYEVYGCGYCLTGDEEVEEALRMAVDALKQEPVRHGHWIKYYETDNGRCLRCSECQCLMVFIVGDGREDNYCPNCGAKMDEGREE